MPKDNFSRYNALRKRKLQNVAHKVGRAFGGPCLDRHLSDATIDNVEGHVRYHINDRMAIILASTFSLVDDVHIRIQFRI